MQFHHHGYVSGDPRIKDAADVGINRPEELPDTMDVLIIGSGPAGMVTAAQLSQFPNITTRIIERRGGRLEIGQADGIQARSVETFQAFGFAERVIQEAYQITEMAFWQPDPENPENIYRADVEIDDPSHVSEFPHLIVNQARILDYFAEFMKFSPTKMVPDYGYEFEKLEIEPDHEYPVKAYLTYSEGPKKGEERIVRAKYALGGDGAHSRVRDSIGAVMTGDVSNHAWGVVDTVSYTDFPDIRTKCAIQSHEGGSILLIPREGGHLVRWYVDLGDLNDENKHTIRATPLEEIVERANKIIHPYKMKPAHVGWYSVYEVGHRLTDRFDDVLVENRDIQDPRVFIAGDACHTHSAKAGQGMNVSMQDAFNLGWKLGYVLDGRSPARLLTTYSDERQVVAQDLINFDRTWSSMMAKRPEDFENPGELAEFYTRTAEFPAGFMTQYAPSMIIGEAKHQELAAGFPIGKRFHSEQVVRVCDATPLGLGHEARADGRWRIHVFADAVGTAPNSKTSQLATWLATDLESPLKKYTPKGADDDAWFDLNVIYQQPHSEIEIPDVPAAFKPLVGPFRVPYLGKAWSIHADVDIFDSRQVSRDGAIVIVRPDQYVANVLPLDASAELSEFFARFLLS